MEILKNNLLLGCYEFKFIESGNYNNNKYSKSYHKKYGGAWEKENSYVIVNRNNEFLKKIEVDNFKGNTLHKIIHELTDKVVSDVPLYVRLNEYYDAKIIKSILGYTIYKRTLLDQFYDYVIVSPDKLTYHDSELKNLFIGLKEKVRTKSLKAENKLVNFKILRLLGFCKDGITQVAEYLELSTSKNYSVDEIVDLFKKSDLRELRQLKKDFYIFCNYYDIDVDILKGL